MNDVSCCSQRITVYQIVIKVYSAFAFRSPEDISVISSMRSGKQLIVLISVQSFTIKSKICISNSYNS